MASAPGTPQERIQVAATALKQLHPDVILLQQVRDEQMCRQLAEALRPAHYQVLVCSAFPDAPSGTTATNQAAILARQPAYASRTQCWRTPNGTNLPGGLVFAAIQTEQVRLGLVSVQLNDQLAQ
ncbi:MAG TPA: hypothetical protein VNT26_22820, partial [Candidatus Sulfotelmatobacter sp.]|nr:hypothetical protein [Candidatus Sulfotelmatobacter sp.]